MKRLMRQLLMVLFLTANLLSPALAASVSEPVAAATAPATEPDPDAVKTAMKEFKGLSRSERKSRLKEAKKVFKDYKAAKKRGEDIDTETLLLAILAIILPPLAVYLKEGEFGVKFWISLALALLVFFTWPLWFISVLFALLVVFDVI